MPNELFTSNAQYGNTPAPNTPGTMAMPTATSQVPGSGIWDAVKSFAGSLNPTSIAGGALNLLGGILDRNFERKEAEKQRNWNEAMVDKQNQFSLDMWNMTNEYNDPSAQVKRLRDAGLNPLYYGLDGSSANAFESAQPLGYERASAGGLMNPLAGMSDALMQSAQIDLINANAQKARSETDSTYLDNEFKQKTLNARVEAQNLANSLTKGQIGKIDDERKQIAENIKKTIAETENEVLKGYLIQAQENLAKMQAKEIAELLPYQKLLMAAQTDAQRGQAALAFANAAIQKGLLEGGYVEKQLADLAAGIKDKQERARAMEIANNIKTGNFFPTDTDSAFNNFWNSIANNVVGSISTLASVITGPIAGIVK